MKKTAILIYLVFYCIPSVVGQNFINIYSIDDSRMPTGDAGYTLNGLRMIGSRSKLSEPANFGTGGIYEKEIIINDDFSTSGSLTLLSLVQDLNLFYFGTFDNANNSFIPFTSAELDTLHEWSRRGGKLIIGASATYPAANFYPDILNTRWGFDIALNTNASTSDYYPTTIGIGTKIFDGPFGSISFANQGGAAMGYFNLLPTNHIVLAEDQNGNPNLILDCETLDLILADGDGHNDLGGVTSGPALTSDNDLFWANTIAFMDSLEGPPIITQNGNLLSTGNYQSVQWLLNGVPIAGANGNTYSVIQSGTYTVQATLQCGCITESPEAVVVTVGLTHSPSISKITMGPNPVKNDNIFFHGIDQQLNGNIYNVEGSLIQDFSINPSEQIVDIKNLKSGFYTVKIYLEENKLVLIQKLIKL